MLGDRYVVTKGDNLWRIAARSLGGGKQWPRIWKYNNRSEIARLTGRRIPNPDLIYVGQVLYIPRLPNVPAVPNLSDEAVGEHLPTAVGNAPALAQSSSSGSQRAATGPKRPDASTPSSLSEQSKRLQFPAAFKYRFEEMRWPPQDVGTAIVEVRMTGDLLLVSKRTYPASFITSRGEVEAQVVSEANHAFGTLVSDNRFIFDPLQKRVTMRSMLVSQSKTPGQFATAIGVEMSSDSPLPKLRAEIRLPKVEGSLNAFRYIALDVKVVLEITPKAPPASAPKMQLERQRVPVTSTREETSSAWRKVIGTGLVITAGVIVVATIVEDFYTVGIGTADDAASFAVAGLALARGLAMVRAAAPPLPQATTGASVTVGASVVLAH